MLLTLAAIKVLLTKFADKKQETKLIVLKGYNYLRAQLSKPNAEVVAMVMQVSLKL